MNNIMISNEIKEKILHAAELADVVGEKIKLQKSGNNLKGLCPFHNEKTPSFTVSPAKNIFKCFGCGKSGDSVKFIMEHNKLNFPEALRYLASKYNIPIEERELSEEELKQEKLSEQLFEINEFATKWYCQNLFLPENALVLEYALSRFSRDEIMEFRIGFAPKDWIGLLTQLKAKGYPKESYLKSTLIKESKGKHYDYFRNRLMFPIMNSTGRVIGFGGRSMTSEIENRLSEINSNRKEPKYLNSSETPLYNKSSVLYGLNIARKTITLNKKAYLVEGYTDLLKLHSLNIHNIVAPCGTALTTGQVHSLRRHTEHVIMIYDGDSAGKMAMIKNGELFLKEGFKVYVVILPDDKDPGDYFTSENISEIEKPLSFVLWIAAMKFNNNGDPEAKHEGIREIIKLIELISDENLQKFYISEISKLHSIPQRDFNNYLKQSSPDKNSMQESNLVPKEVDLKEFNKWGFYQYKNQYFFSDRDGRPVRQSNFILKPLFHVKSSEDARRIFEVTNLHGSKIVSSFDGNEMTSLQRFKKNIEEKGNYIFLGNDTHMTKLKHNLYEETKTCLEVKNLGWQKEGFWAWSNGLQTENGFTPISEHGLIEFNEVNYFIPAFSSIYKNDKTLFIDERKFKYSTGDITSYQWSEKLVQVFGDNAKVAVAFWVAAVFRDHILQIFGNFPILNLFGPKGTGKSQLAISLTAMFGQPQTPFNIHNGTKPGLADHLQQFINGIAFIDEYKNAIDYDKIEVVKSIYDSIGRSRMNMDKKKKETTAINQAVVICGQDMMTADIALLSRTIFLQYSKAHFGDEAKAAYDQFKGWESNGFAHLTAELLSHRTYFEDNFHSVYKETFADYNSALAKEHVEDRIIRSMCSVVAGFRCISEKMSFSFNYKNLFDFTVESLIFHNKQLSTSSELGIFWDMFETMFDEDLIIDKWHFRLDYTNHIKHNSGEITLPEGKYFLKFKFNTIAKLYIEQARRMGKTPLGSDTLKYYLVNDPAFRGNSKSTRFYKKDLDKAEGKIMEKKQVTSAMIFSYEDLGINLERGPVGELDKTLDEAKISRSPGNQVEKPLDGLPF